MGGLVCGDEYGEVTAYGEVREVSEGEGGCR